MWGYRCGFKSLGVDSRLIVDREHQFGYPYDELHVMKGVRAHLKFLTEMVSRFDIFHTFSGLSLLPRNIDVPFLKTMDKKLITTFIGSDIRCNLDVLYGKLDKKDCNFCLNPHKCRKNTIEKMVRFWERNGDLLISGMNCTQMLDYLKIPYRQFTLSIDTDYWKRYEPKINVDKSLGPVIVHATSRPEIKATYLFIDIIKKLKEEGYKINVKIIQNKPSSFVREWLNVADIVFDQITLGWHGGFAVESMAMSNTVLSYTRDTCRQISEQTHPDAPKLPIINVTRDTLYEELRSLLDDDSRQHKLAKKSREYVEKVHDNKVVCKDLLDIYRRL